MKVAILPRDGLSIIDAIEAFTEPTDWKKYCHLHSIAGNRRMVVYVMDPDRRALARQHNEAIILLQKTWREILRAFALALYEGRLIASAIEWPDSPSKQRIQVPAEKWMRLSPIPNDSSARGDGYRLVDILVQPAQGYTWDSARNSLGSKVIEAPRRRKRPPGRPSALQLVQKMMSERARSRELLGSMKEEANWLANWNNAQAGHPPITAKTIYNKVGKEYRRLRDASPAR
jgi:hypothetical protein